MADLGPEMWQRVGSSWVLDLSEGSPRGAPDAPLLAVYRTVRGQWAAAYRLGCDRAWVDVWPTWPRRQDAQRSLLEYASHWFGPEWQGALSRLSP